MKHIGSTRIRTQTCSLNTIKKSDTFKILRINFNIFRVIRYLNKAYIY